MDYYHSKTTPSPPVKKLSKLTISSHSSNETGKSTLSEKKITSNIHLFFAQQDNEDDLPTRKLSSIPSMPNLPVTETVENKINDIPIIEKNPQRNNTTRLKNKKKNNSNKKIETMTTVPRKILQMSKKKKKKCMQEVVTLNLQTQKN